MKTKSLLFVVAFLVIFSLLFTSCLDHKRLLEMKESLHGYFMYRMKIALDLTTDQVKEIKEIQEEIMEKVLKSLPKHKKYFNLIEDFFTSDYLSAQDVLNFKEKIREKHANLRIFMAEKFAEFHAILTPEQREKVIKILKKCLFPKYKHLNTDDD